MHVTIPNIIRDGDQFKYKVKVKMSSTVAEQELWYSVPEAYTDFISESADAALVALLFPAMAHGEDITLEGAISEELFYTMSSPYQVILRHVFPSLNKVNIYAREWHRPNGRANGVVTGFSGGIDSFCVLADHYYSNNIPKKFRITHLLFSNVGSHGAGGETLFDKRYQRVEQAARHIGLPIFPVNSNLDSFYIDLGYAFIDTHTPRNASVAHLLSNGISRYYFSSTFDYKSLTIGATHGGLPRSEPVFLPLLGTPSVDLISTGSEYTRVEKTLKIAAIDDTRELLDICVKAKKAQKVGKVNCSICWKCMRTLLTLEIADNLDNYQHLFDLKLYRRHRNRYIATILKKDDPLTQEIISFARAQNYKLPVSAKLLAYTGLYKFLPQFERARRVGKRILRIGMKKPSGEIIEPSF